MIDSIGGRKFFGFLLVLGLATVVQICSPGGVNAAYAALLTGALATFATANAYVTAKMTSQSSPAPGPMAQMLDEAIANAEAPSAEADPSVDAIKADVAQLQATVMTLANSVQATNNLLRVAGLGKPQA